MDDTELRAQLAAHHPASFGWALSCCRRDPQRAEDVLQTAYLQILSGRARYEGRAAFKTWLFAVIRRTAANEWRRSLWRALRLVPLRADHEPLADAGDDTARTGRRADFQAALVRLPARQREVLHLVFYEDLTIEQAAAIMGVSLGSARQHYARGKDHLRRWLQASEGTP